MLRFTGVDLDALIRIRSTILNSELHSTNLGLLYIVTDVLLVLLLVDENPHA